MYTKKLSPQQAKRVLLRERKKRLNMLGIWGFWGLFWVGEPRARFHPRLFGRGLPPDCFGF